MGLIVQKFGGSSVANAERVMNVAKIVTDTYREGNDVVVVVSAQGDTTDDLIDKAHEINEHPSKREMDMLLTSGEQISIALLSMAIEKLGCPSVSLLGWQAGFRTSSAYGSARIKSIKTDRLRAEVDRHNIVVVAGFQGINRYDDLTTLGRGGSDTSAVAIAAAMHADSPPTRERYPRRESSRKLLTTKCLSLQRSARRFSITVPWKWQKNTMLK